MYSSPESFFLETERFLLRPWKLSDYPNFSRLAKNPQIMRFVNQEKHWRDKRIRIFIHKQEKLFCKEGYCRWVVEDKIKCNFVGLCGVGVFDPTGLLEIGWWIAKRFWRQGYATEAARCALEHAFMKIRIPHLKSVMNQGNEASIAVMHNICFQQKMSGFLGDYLRSPKYLPIVTYSLDYPYLHSSPQK
jgi:RimJ/RimL family protein N-acetyltransferase